MCLTVRGHLGGPVDMLGRANRHRECLHIGGMSVPVRGLGGIGAALTPVPARMVRFCSVLCCFLCLAVRVYHGGPADMLGKSARCREHLHDVACVSPFRGSHSDVSVRTPIRAHMVSFCAVPVLSDVSGS
jgi:hypothetical protein